MKKKGGFSLIELIVAIAIIGIVIFVGTDTYLTGLISSKKEYHKAQLSGDARVVTEGMIGNIKLGSGVEDAFGAYTSNETTLILLLPAIDSSNNFIYEADQQIFDRIIYFLAGNSLHKITLSTNQLSRLYSQNESEHILLTNVKSVVFTYDASPPNTNNVVINLTVQELKINPPLEYNVNVKGILRNA